MPSKTTLWIVGSSLAVAFLLYFFLDDYRQGLSWLRNALQETSPLLFIASMSLMPLVGVPITLFIFLVGLRFGVLCGTALLFLTVPIHLMLSFYAMKSTLQPVARRLLNRLSYRSFRIPQDPSPVFIFLFVLIPGLPYAVKIYLFPLSGVSFKRYFLIAWPVYAVSGAPLIFLGYSFAQMNPWFLTAGLFLLVLLYAAGRYLYANLS